MYKFREGEVLLIHKPLHWTSFQVVNKLKYIIKKFDKVISQKSLVDSPNSDSRPKTQDSRPKTQDARPKTQDAGLETQDARRKTQDARPEMQDQRLKTKDSRLKIGHAGTLDPLASGLLIVCTGKQTKNIEQYQAQEKEYTGTFCIGSTTPSFDLEKEIDAHYPTQHITEQLIYETTKQFIGTIEQIPPLFSAIKIDGKRAYDIARAGKTAEIKAKQITIYEFEIIRIGLPYIDFRVVCSKGTYIRSLARDFGLALNSGAHLTALCRTRIGNYKLQDALTIEAFENTLAV